MKILYYANMRLIEGDGPSSHIISVCRELSRRNHRVVVITRQTERWRMAEPFSIIYIPTTVCGYTRLWLRDLLWSLFCNTIMVAFRPAVIYERQSLRDTYAHELSERFRVPRIIEVNGWEDNKDLGPYRSIQLGCADAVIVTAPGHKRLVISEGGVPSDKVFYIPNGVNMHLFHPMAQPDNENCMVGYVGYSHEHHDIATVLRAVSLVIKKGGQLQLRLIGSSLRDSDWRQLSQELGIQSSIVFAGRVAHELLPAEIAKLDICLAVYSRSRLETAGGTEHILKLWEYWAMRKAVIVADIPGSQSYPHHLENRYLAVEPENPAELAAAISKLCHDRQKREKLGEQGYSYVLANNTWEAIVDMIERVLTTTIGE